MFKHISSYVRNLISKSVVIDVAIDIPVNMPVNGVMIKGEHGTYYQWNSH